MYTASPIGEDGILYIWPASSLLPATEFSGFEGWWICVYLNALGAKEIAFVVPGADMSFNLSGSTQLQRPSAVQLAIPMSATVLLALIQYFVAEYARELHSLCRPRTHRCRVGYSPKRATEAPNQLPTRSCPKPFGPRRRQPVEFVLLKRPKTCDDQFVQFATSKRCVPSR